MIIVFFHALYLFSRLVYNHFKNNCEHEINEGNEPKQMRPRKVDPYSAFYEDENTLRFSPPAYLQRYDAVASVLIEDRFRTKIRKVVDFGCSEMGFFQHLKNIYGIDQILCVDINRNTLERYKHKIEPYTADYLSSRSVPLTVTILEGSVTKNDEYLADSDAVICIELIEHLYPNALMDLPFNIFGFIQPLVAIFTTPNAEFNVLFKTLKKFRHPDHKFEWTREQFEDWAINITKRYPAYTVAFQGIGQGPVNAEFLGCCSQMAIFTRTGEKRFLAGIENLLKVVTEVTYPYRASSLTIEKATLDEAEYYIYRYAMNNQDEEMPLELLADQLQTVPIQDLRQILENNDWDIVEHPHKGLAVLCQVFTECSELGENQQDLFHDDMEQYYENNWNDEPSPLGYHDQDWPEIYDQDEDDWNNDNELSVHPSAHVSVATSESSSSRVDSPGPARSEGDSDNDHSRCSIEMNVSELESSDNVYKNRRVEAEIVDRNRQLGEFDELSSDSSSRAQSDTNLSLPIQEHVDIEFVTPVVRQPRSTIFSSPESEILPQVKYQPHLNLRARPLYNLNRQNSAMYAYVPNTTDQTNFLDLEPEGDVRQPLMDICEAVNVELTGTKSHSATGISSSDQRGKVRGGLSMNSPKSRPGLLDLPLQLASESSKSNAEDDKSSQLAKIEHPQPSTSSVQIWNLDAENACSLNYQKSSSDDAENTKSRSSDDLRKQHCGSDEAHPDSTKSINEFLEKDKLLKDSEEKFPSGSPKSPPNSWSPEVMDSGYANTASTNDMTPECDLPSIAQDRILESESPSLAEPPRPNFEQLGHVEVENGDLANNNRDGEGNNLGPAEENDLDNLQPLIDGLENDLENENDIYDFQNGFPIWLLRILDVEGYNR